VEPADLLNGNAIAAAVYEKVRSCLNDVGTLEVRTTKSQIARESCAGTRPLVRLHPVGHS